LDPQRAVLLDIPDVFGALRCARPSATPMTARHADIGRIMDEIRADAPNTIVILTADNGAWLDAYPDAGTTPFRGEKGSPFEGGWRVPGIMWWPNRIAAGARFDEMMSHIDCWATLAAMAGLTPPPHDWVGRLARRFAELCPRIHQLAPLFQRGAAAVGGLGLIVDRVRKGGLGNLTREFRMIAASRCAAPLNLNLAPQLVPALHDRRRPARSRECPRVPPTTCRARAVSHGADHTAGWCIRMLTDETSGNRPSQIVDIGRGGPSST
jgi:hypothetical protein